MAIKILPVELSRDELLRRLRLVADSHLENTFRDQLRFVFSPNYFNLLEKDGEIYFWKKKGFGYGVAQLKMEGLPGKLRLIVRHNPIGRMIWRISAVVPFLFSLFSPMPLGGAVVLGFLMWGIISLLMVIMRHESAISYKELFEEIVRDNFDQVMAEANAERT